MSANKTKIILLLPVAFLTGLLLHAFSSTAPPPLPSVSVLPTSFPPPTITPTPTPRPPTFKELNALYGPCAAVPTLLYHHIQDLNDAKAQGHLWLAVSPETFKSHLQYLIAHHYNPISPNNLVEFFNHGTSLPSKPVLLTFDDGYVDFYLNAFPLLKQFSLPAVLFLPTGLTDNPGYVTWKQVAEMNNSGQVFIGNHTWSHRDLKADLTTIEKEITIADQQLSDRGLNRPKVFAYPFGIESQSAKKFLVQSGYNLAFSTLKGSILCQKQSLDLPRIRIANLPLSSYGL